MLGPFATASRRTPHCHSPGVATVTRHLRIGVHNNNDDAWKRGPLWPHRMGPTRVSGLSCGIICRRTDTRRRHVPRL